MKSIKSKPRRDEIAGYFNQHCAPLYVQFGKGSEVHHYVFSTFVISIDDRWFLVTAGHCLREIEDILEAGYTVVKAGLMDYGGLDAKYFHPIPFSLEVKLFAHLNDDKYDYGIIYLENYYRKLMEKNGIVALNEEVWKKQPQDPDFYVLLGVPGQLTEVNEDTITITTILNTVERCDSRPAQFEKTNAPTFYAKIDLDDDLESIKGMSGGPILSFKISESGELKYWLCAVQSRWIKKDKLIAGCLMTPFASLVKDCIREEWQQNA